MLFLLLYVCCLLLALTLTYIVCSSASLLLLSILKLINDTMSPSASGSGHNHPFGRSISMAEMNTNSLNVVPMEHSATENFNMAGYFSTLKETDDPEDDGIFF